MLLPAIALALASCASPYAGYGGGYYGGYADYAYPDDLYSPAYGGVAFGDFHHFDHHFDHGHFDHHFGHHAGLGHGGMGGHGGHGGGGHRG
jgi:hypothetical protein